MKPIAVAIDGPSGAGKSTIARFAAEALGFIYVDTGALYRAIGLAVCRAGAACDDAEAVCALLPRLVLELTYQDGAQRVLLCGDDVSDAIRTPEISQAASLVSAIPRVREYLLALQRNMAKTRSVIMDGRDIGTVILPNAQVKIFLTASAEKRARRRCLELREKGQSVTQEQVLADMQQRDSQDAGRAVAPLRQATDAVRIDTSELSLQQSIDAVLFVIREGLRAQP